MKNKKISLEDFCHDISANREYVVDINSLIGVCGASPVRAYYKTDRVAVSNICHDSILLASGENYINIGQIQGITKSTSDDGRVRKINAAARKIESVLREKSGKGVLIFAKKIN